MRHATRQRRSAEHETTATLRSEDGREGCVKQAKGTRSFVTQLAAALRAARPPQPRLRCRCSPRRARAPLPAPAAKRGERKSRRQEHRRCARACHTSARRVSSSDTVWRRKCSSGVCFSPTSLATACRSGTALSSGEAACQSEQANEARRRGFRAHAPARQQALRARHLARHGVPADVGAPQVGRHAHLPRQQRSAGGLTQQPRVQGATLTSSTAKPLPCMKRSAMAPEFIAVDSARRTAAPTARGRVSG